MNRVEFTIHITALLNEMILLGEHPIIDFVKRSDQEQYRLYQIGRAWDEGGTLLAEDRSRVVTNCDGKFSISAHQRGTAMDIYFIEENKIVAPKMGYDYWRNRWESKGGKPEIRDANGNPRDRGHYEG